MKTLISHVRRSLPAFSVVLLLALTASAQTTVAVPQATPTPYILNQSDPVQSAAFNISGTGKANIFDAVLQFNIGGDRVLSVAGTHNVFAGTGAGAANTTGADNAFFGTSAGAANKNGGFNSFFGVGAGALNTGNANSFFGSNAGGNSRATVFNSFFGVDAGWGNEDGSFNSYFGNEAGYRNISGANNSFTGWSAGHENTYGSYNAFFGNETGRDNTNGNYNSFFGSYAGRNNVNGNKNTVIGAYADVAEGSFFHATAIGAYARVTASDTIMLGKIQGTYENVSRPADTVIVSGLLQLETLGSGSGGALCRNKSKRVMLCSASSLRYKKNVAAFSSGLELLQRLRPISFEWKEDGMKDVGFGAEDIAAVEPLLVNYNEKGQVEGVKYDRLTTVLVNAVKQQQEQIEAQQQQLKQQQTMIDGLKKLLCGQNPAAEVCRQ